MNDTDRLEAISIAIHMRDNNWSIPEKSLPSMIFDLSNYGVFSNRQIAILLGGRIPHNKVKTFTGKSRKTGGRIAPSSLEDIREALFSRTRNNINYEAIARALKAGTSQSMVAALSGVPQSSISRNVKKLNG